MIIDLKREPPADDVVYDVCIVGAGAAGIALTVEMRRKGKRVLLLEGGGPRFEQASQDLYAGEADGMPYAGLQEGRFRVLGGATTQWGGQIRELAPHLFDPRPWAPNPAWPFSKSELVPYYRRAVEIEGLDTAMESADEVWDALGLAKPAFGPDFVSEFSRWCPERNFAVLHVKVLRDPDVSLYLHANLEGLDFAEDGQSVRAVRCRAIGGAAATFRAKAVVLCLGGIETSRFLLQSAADAGPAPWRGNPWIGRGYQDHVVSGLATIVDCKLKPLAGYFDYRAVRGHRYLHRINVTPEAQERLGILDLGFTVSLSTNGVDNLAKAFGTLRRVLTGRVLQTPVADLRHLAVHFPTLLWQRLPISKTPVGQRWEDGAMRVDVHCEQTVESGGEVTLSEDRNALGQRRPRVTWRIGDLELRSIRTALALFCKAFEDNGHGKIVLDSDLMEDDERLRGALVENFHHIGGARMAASAGEGVVDADLKLFGTTNAYICSAAVFPSAGYVNPTHTVIALAARLAEHLAVAC